MNQAEKELGFWGRPLLTDSLPRSFPELPCTEQKIKHLPASQGCWRSPGWRPPGPSLTHGNGDAGRPQEEQCQPCFPRCSTSMDEKWVTALRNIQVWLSLKKIITTRVSLSLKATHCCALGKPHVTQHLPLPSSDSWPSAPASWISAAPCCSVPAFSSRFPLGNTKQKKWIDGAVSDDN